MQGGQGAQFRFDFSGDNTGAPVGVPVNGNFSVKFRETGDVVSYQGPATISPDLHQLLVDIVTCSVTTAGGMTFSVVACSLFGADEANSDVFQLVLGIFPVFAEAGGQVVSGGMTID